MDINPDNQAAVFQADDRTGSYLWVALPPYERFTTLLETNSFLRDVAEAQFKKLEYRSADGQDLIAWVMLPIGYHEGTRYPMITNVHRGQVYGNSPPKYDINHTWQSPYLNPTSY